jgi:hypothetical protein
VWINYILPYEKRGVYYDCLNIDATPPSGEWMQLTYEEELPGRIVSINKLVVRDRQKANNENIL